MTQDTKANQETLLNHSGDSAATIVLKPSSRRLLVAIMLFGAFITILNQTLLAAALPSIMRDLNISPNRAQWLSTVFMLVNGIMIPITAFLIHKFTNRQLYIGAMMIFAIGTIIGAFAPNFQILLLARIVQAVGAGVIMPMMQTIMLYIFPKEKRGYAMGIMGIVIGFAPSIGPTLSGAIVDAFSWNALFYVVAPIAILNIIFAIKIMRNITERTRPKLDIPSIILSTVGFGGLLYGFSEAGTFGWSSPVCYVPIIVGAICLVFFAKRQLAIATPLLEIKVFANKSFAFGTLFSMICFALMIAAENQLPLYIQTVRGYSALQSGLMLLPGAIAVGIMSPITGKMFDNIGPRFLAILGLSIAALGTAGLSFINIQTHVIFIASMYCVRMVGISMVTMPMTTWGLNGLLNRQLAHGTAVNSTMRQVTASIVTALMITVMTSSAGFAQTSGRIADSNLAMVYGLNVSFRCAAIAFVVLLVLAIIFVHDYEHISKLSKRLDLEKAKKLRKIQEKTGMNFEEFNGELRGDIKAKLDKAIKKKLRLEMKWIIKHRIKARFKHKTSIENQI